MLGAAMVVVIAEPDRTAPSSSTSTAPNSSAVYTTPNNASGKASRATSVIALAFNIASGYLRHTSLPVNPAPCARAIVHTDSNTKSGSSLRITCAVAVFVTGSNATRTLCPARRPKPAMSCADAVGLPSITWMLVTAEMGLIPNASAYSIAYSRLAGFFWYAFGSSWALASSCANATLSDVDVAFTRLLITFAPLL